MALSIGYEPYFFSGLLSSYKKNVINKNKIILSAIASIGGGLTIKSSKAVTNLSNLYDTNDDDVCTTLGFVIPTIKLL